MNKSIAKPKKDFTSGPLLRQILLFTLPLIATSVLQLLFNTADTVVVGRWGGDTPEACENALAAVGSCGALINLLVNLFFGLSVGAGVAVAHDFGAGKYDEVKKTVHTSVLTALCGGFVAMLIGLFAARPLLTLMGTESGVLDQAVPYMIAYFCGMPANMLYNYCAAVLRSTGDSKRPLFYLTTAGIANVLLNLVMVLVFRMGALGVGIATAASQWISAALVLIYMLRTDDVCHVSPRELRFHGDKLRKMLYIGLPAGIQGCLFSLSNVIIQSSINSFGRIVVAGNTAAANLEGYIYVCQNALYTAALTFVGQNLGAGKIDRLKKSGLLCLAVVCLVGITLGALMVAFGHPLLSLYAPGNNEVIAAGMIRLRMICLTYFLCGAMEIGCGILRGIGKAILPMVVSLLGSCAFRIVWIMTVFTQVRTLECLFISYPISWLATGAVHFLFVFFALRKLKKEQLVAA